MAKNVQYLLCTLILTCVYVLVQAAPCGDRNCGLPSNQCCNDTTIGLTCYDPNGYSCVRSGSGFVLCGSNQQGFYGACGTQCYDTSLYSCCNSQLYSSSAGNSPCVPATSGPATSSPTTSSTTAAPSTQPPPSCAPGTVQLLQALFTQLEPLFSNPFALQITGELVTTFISGLDFNRTSPEVLVEVRLITSFLQGLLQGAGQNGGNISLSSIPPTALVQICQVIQGLGSSQETAGASIELLEYDIGNLLALLQAAIANRLTPGALFDPADLPVSYKSSNAPAAVRLALVPSGMVVSWQTSRLYSGNFKPTVAYGTSARTLNKIATGVSHTYGTSYFHDVVINGLNPTKKYFYKLLSVSPTVTPVKQQSGVIRSFTTAAAAGSTKPLAITLVGDMGITNANDTHNAMLNLVDDTDVFVHIGDLSYADNYFMRADVGDLDQYEGTWDSWQQWLQPITSQVPYMVLPGNHEAQCQELLPGDDFCPPGQFNFTAYRNRFRMPSAESGAGQVQNMWSSFDVGQLHVVLLDTETDFPGAPEGDGTTMSSGPFGGSNTQTPALLSWLASDLRKANNNRAKVPWVIVMGHRPIYASDTSPISFTPAVRFAFEALLIQYKVDVYMCGHLHYYERLFPIANGVPQTFNGNVYLNPSSPTYIVNGAAGNDERHDTAPRNTTISALLNDSDFGYSRLFVHNKTHFEAKFFKSRDNSVIDDLWIVKNV